MKNVTLTLEESVFARARVAAAKEGKGLSKFVAELVEAPTGRVRTKSQALASWLAGPALFEAGEAGRPPSGAELYDDAGFRSAELRMRNRVSAVHTSSLKTWARHAWSGRSVSLIPSRPTRSTS